MVIENFWSPFVSHVHSSSLILWSLSTSLLFSLLFTINLNNHFQFLSYPLSIYLPTFSLLPLPQVSIRNKGGPALYPSDVWYEEPMGPHLTTISLKTFRMFTQMWRWRAVDPFYPLFINYNWIHTYLYFLYLICTIFPNQFQLHRSCHNPCM